MLKHVSQMVRTIHHFIWTCLRDANFSLICTSKRVIGHNYETVLRWLEIGAIATASDSLKAADIECFNKKSYIKFLIRIASKGQIIVTVNFTHEILDKPARP